MSSLSNAKHVPLLVLALLPIGSGLAGVLLASARPDSAAPGLPLVAPEPESRAAPPARDDARPRPRNPAFPDAATLQSLAIEGRIESTRLPDAAELAELQRRIDRFNALWEMTTLRLHRRIAVVTEAMIERGELQPYVAAERRVGDEVIGRRLTVVRGVPYEKAFYAGDDEGIDAFQRRLDTLARLVDNAVRTAFQ